MRAFFSFTIFLLLAVHAVGFSAPLCQFKVINNHGGHQIATCERLFGARAQRVAVGVTPNDGKADDSRGFSPDNESGALPPTEAGSENSDRPSFMGLSSKKEVDSLDNGLLFLGPILLLVQLSIMWEMVFGTEVPITFGGGPPTPPGM
mmetsp:Transcript_3796/g.8082  ORF Transcript_3796/g.8082 Transcript_3796/m.8082 type:complete len:148 (-) Transcript_3796:181-624(-)